MKKLIWKIVLAASLLLMVIAATNIALLIREYQKGINTYANLEKYATVTQDSVKAAQEIKDTADSGNTEEAVEEVIEGPQIAVDLDIDYDALTKINGDFVGWIYYAPLELSYPIVRGIDNDYYTHYTFENVRNSSGAIFMDFLNKPDFSHFNTIIYGHNMEGNMMFANLNRYEQPEFLKLCPEIEILTPERKFLYRIFSVEQASSHSPAFEYGYELSSSAYKRQLSVLKNNSMYDTGVEPNETERMVTLITCNSHLDKEIRMAVHGICYEIEKAE